ncbi:MULTISPECIES: hypothetical protein [unclassified Sphingomonas]|uniref:hypothetical protein n=1 Tax=unclassified Sphingomonas TaxID=196159 RepID=UPI002269A5DC|nr:MULTISPECIES: hypothetical protein [unclassified Sphingomonas]
MFGIRIISNAQLAALKAQGVTLGTAAASGLTKAVAVAAQIGNPIGAATLAAVTAAEVTGKPGADKRADVIAAVAPLVVTEAAKGGVSAVVTDAEQFAGLVLEEVLASVKPTPIVAIGLALLKALGIG